MKKSKTLKQSLLLLFAAVIICSSFLFAFSASAASAKKISSCTVTVAKTVDYTGKSLKPTVTVKSGRTTLKNGKHYTVTYSNNKNVGTAKVVVTAKKGGGYAGSKSANFDIVPAKAKSLTATSTASSVTLTWSKVAGATQYVVYSYNSSNKKYTKVATVTKNTATIKKLSAGQTYSYAVKAQAVKNKKTYSSAYSAVFSCATAPAKPASVKISGITDTSMTVTWGKVTGASGYKVYSYNASNKKYTLLTTVTTNKATLTSLKANTSYQIAVRAYKKVSNTLYYGAYSALASATTNVAKVSGVKATAAATSVTLTWNKVTGATGYNVYEYNASKKTYTLKASVATNSATISALNVCATYQYAVRACKKSGKTETMGAYSAIVTVTTPVGKVTNVKVSAVTASSVTLTWDNVAGVTGYKVYEYNTSKKTYSLKATVAANQATISSLKPGTSYSYAVKMYKTEGRNESLGEYSSVVTALTLPEKVAGLKAVATDYAATLTWNKASGASGYNVYSYDAVTKKDIAKVASTTSTSAVIYNLELNKSYSYRVEAYNSAKAAGEKSDVATAKTQRVDYLTKYQNIFKSGTYAVNFNMPLEGMKGGLDVKYATKGGNICVKLDFAQMMEAAGETSFKDLDMSEMGNMDAVMYHVAKNKKEYIVLFDFFYADLKNFEMDMNDFSVETMKAVFAPEAAAGSTVVESAEKINGKTYSTASYTTKSGDTCKYYFLNGELVRIDSISPLGDTSSITITSVSATVDDSAVSLPKAFPLGYLPLS